jgi:predicted cobalt transporter CbtA
MNKRPLSITVISFVFAAAGAIGLAYHLIEFKAQHPFQYDIVWVSLVRLTAVVCGMFMLRGSNWARWLTLIWMAYHVVLSGFHSLHEVVVHGLLLAVFAYFLFRPRATEYFHAKGKGTT